MENPAPTFQSILYMALWCLVVGPAVVALPWIFAAPMFYFFGGPPALLAGIFLGFRFRSRPIPEKVVRRAVCGAQAGALATAVCYLIVALIGSLPKQTSFLLGVLVFAAIGAFAGAVAFAVMPARLRRLRRY
jgi:hypothetical protein